MYDVKQKPEDFFVEEIPDINLGKKQDDYLYFFMEKKNWNTRDLVSELAKRLGIRPDRINIAGIKDKNAVTRQTISIFRVPKNKVLGIKIKDAYFEFIGYGSERLKLGQIIKNRFRIVVRNLENKNYNKITFIENYFDEQRFSKQNAEVGLALVKKDFYGACNLLNIEIAKNDPIGAIRKNIDRKLLLFYVNAYQSFLFNKIIMEYIRMHSSNCFTVKHENMEFIFSNQEIKNMKMPIMGFLTIIRNKEINNLYKHLLAREGINKEDFLFPMMPELSSEGNERNLIVDVEANIAFQTDDLNPGRFKAILDFKLEKGAYATIAVKKIFGC